MSYADEARDALANGEQADSEIATLTTEVERLTKIIDESPAFGDDIWGCDRCGATTTDCSASNDGDDCICRACDLTAKLEILQNMQDQTDAE